MIKFFSKQLKNKKGFTLVELIVVIAILGILAAIAVPKISSFRTQAAITAHNANVRTLQGAANMWLAENGMPTEGGEDEGDEGDGKIEWPGEFSEDNEEYSKKDEWGKYIEEWPNVPTGASVVIETGDPNEGEPYKVTIAAETGKVTVAPGYYEDTENGDV